MSTTTLTLKTAAQLRESYLRQEMFPTIFCDGCGLGNCHGYECGKGWDAVTGLGSLNFGKASAYIARLLERKQQ